MLDDRVNRLLDKAEAAIEAGDNDKGEAFRILATNSAYLSRKEARAIERLYTYQSLADE